jgi:hypothetical protein
MLERKRPALTFARSSVAGGHRWGLLGLVGHQAPVDGIVSGTATLPWGTCPRPACGGNRPAWRIGGEQRPERGCLDGAMIDTLRSAPDTASMPLSYRQRASSISVRSAPSGPTPCLSMGEGSVCSFMPTGSRWREQPSGRAATDAAEWPPDLRRLYSAACADVDTLATYSTRTDDGGHRLASSVRVIGGPPPCRPAFPQVGRDRRGEVRWREERPLRRTSGRRRVGVASHEEACWIALTAQWSITQELQAPSSSPRGLRSG